MKRLAAIALCLITASHAATPPPPAPLTLEQALQRVGVNYKIDCGLRFPGTATLEMYDVINVRPYWTLTVNLTDMPLTQTVYSGGPAVVYIRVTCAAASGTPAMARATYKFHYPEAPLLLLPSAPTGIKVT